MVQTISEFFSRVHVSGTCIQVGTLTEVLFYSGDVHAFLNANKFTDLYFLGGVDKNLCAPAPHKRATKNEHVKEKKYTFFDFDIRSQLAKLNKEVSNDDIKNLAEVYKDAVKYHPIFKDWGAIVFSGNGLHVYYFSEVVAVDNQQYSLGYVNQCLEISKIFGYEADQQCQNTGRIARMPGSYNNKNGLHSLVEIIESQESNSLLLQKMMSYRAPKLERPPQKTYTRAESIEFTGDGEGPEDVPSNFVSVQEVLDFVHATPARRLCEAFGITINRDYSVVLAGETTSTKLNEKGNYFTRFSGKPGSGDFIKVLEVDQGVTFRDAIVMIAEKCLHKDIEWNKQDHKELAAELGKLEQIRLQLQEKTDIHGRFMVPLAKNMKTWGVDAVDEMFGNVRDGEFILFLGEPGTGKCHGKGTKIMMADGSIKLVENIVVGDQLMGPDKKPRNVLRLGRGRDEMYLFVPVDNPEDQFVVNGPHILSLKHWKTGEIQNMSVVDYIASSDDFRDTWYLYRAEAFADQWGSSRCHLTICQIVHLKEDDYYGFELDGDHLYLLDSFIVTHNTSYTLFMAMENAKRGVKCLFISLEMARFRLEDRYIELYAGISQENREKANYSPHQITRMQSAIAELQNDYLHIVDMDHLGDQKRDWKLIKSLIEDYDLVFIDNFSKIVPRGNSEENQRQAEISEEIAQYVEKSGKTIVMLHHYAKKVGNSRGLEARGSQKLIDDISAHISLERLDESGGIAFECKKGRYIPVGKVGLVFQAGKYKSDNSVFPSEEKKVEEKFAKRVISF